MKELRYLIFDKFGIPIFDTVEEDWVELQWEFENLILSKKATTMFDAKRAEKAWLSWYETYKTK
jgi:hypothetical protein